MVSKKVEEIKKQYVSGTKIKLIKMYDEQEIAPNTEGVVAYVDDLGIIHMKWSNGSSLGLIVDLDKFEIIQ